MEVEKYISLITNTLQTVFLKKWRWLFEELIIYYFSACVSYVFRSAKFILVNVLKTRVQECNHGKGVNIDSIVLLVLLTL